MLTLCSERTRASSSAGGRLSSSSKQLKAATNLVDAQKVGERKDRCAVRPSAVLFFGLVFLATLPQATIPAAARPHPVVRVAPADEYFGRMKMSILGIRNQLHDLTLRLQFAPDKSEDVIGSAVMVEDAMLDWEHKYPADPWLAKSVYELTTLYANVHTAHGHSRAAHCLRWLLTRYGHTPYGAMARAQIKPQVGLR